MVYRLSRDITLRAEEMEKQLASMTFTPCGSQDMAKMGWVPPMGSHSDALNAHRQWPNYYLRAQRRENPAIASDQNRLWRRKSRNWEADQGRKLKKTEKDSLKDEVLHSLAAARV
ncbi:recombination associated protein [Salmonella enterica subsp. enterica serovar Daytona]|uniref:Recombination-associated protein RdgC n=1 Tax=Salmonella enterica subsp. enterica serovar Daytona TaxID=1962639 RepID=A0A447JMG0_SALET|nr:recombination associated protein [Salmonella enterica subsp. enterica serovar Daytona]